MTPRVLFATAELYPYVKTGGLGDVAAGLPPALKQAGIDVRYLLPGYLPVLAALTEAVEVRSFSDLFSSAARLLRGQLPGGMTAYILDIPAFYHRDAPYTYAAGKDWPDNHLRFGALCHVAAHLDAYDRWWRPDIVHGHDWHCGLVSAYLSLRGAAAPASVVTIHNIAYQGLFPMESAQLLGIPAHMMTPEGCEYYNQLGFLKSGLHYAQAITTVSPTYAREIMTPQFGCGLEGLLTRRAADLHGIINGIDPEVWDPAKDILLPHRYSARRLAGKQKNKRALLGEFNLEPEDSMPLAGIVSRLTPQKGIDALADILPSFLEQGMRLAVLGTGDAEVERQLAGLAARYPGRLGLRLGYDEALAHRIIAGADMALLPSRFEPCGLVQLYALRYGSLPLVHATGGLADTVEHMKTGFSYQEDGGLADCLSQALAAWQDKKAWRKMMRNAMAQDWSWQASAQHYARLYESVMLKAAERAAPAGSLRAETL